MSRHALMLRKQLRLDPLVNHILRILFKQFAFAAIEILILVAVELLKHYFYTNSVI
jgi:hypothetical protein